MIKDAVDIVPFLCGHYLRSGFDRLVFIDDGSTDGTLELLSSIGRRTKQVVVERAGSSAFRQKDLVNAAANAMIAAGYQIIFPFDSDEFWNLDSARIRIAATQPGVFVGRWVQFVQDRSETGFSRRGLLKATYRAPIYEGMGSQLVRDYQRPLLCHTLPKVGFRAEGEVSIVFGQHALRDGPSTVLASDLEVFHLPLRTAAVIDRRAAHAERTFVDARPKQNWQAGYFRDEARAGRQAILWAANSASSDGFLDLPNSRVLLIEDRRLSRLLRRAWIYMAIRHPVPMARHVQSPAGFATRPKPVSAA